MRWYFAIDEAGALGETGADAKTAVLSAAARGQLEPNLLYYGARTELTDWMAAHGVTIIDAAPAFLETIRSAEAAGIYQAHSIGHWLRVCIPAIEAARAQKSDVVLYTDCDVIFLKSVPWQQIRPATLAAAPEFKKDNWNYFNAGVMVINVAALTASYPAFESLICARITDAAHYHGYDDQLAFNEAYRHHWERLAPELNWKPYWGFDPTAALLHFHGPKLGALAAIAAGTWGRDNPTAIQLGAMADAHLDSYIAWAETLGDQLQMIDFSRARQFNALASALLRYRKSQPFQAVDDSFMDIRMF